MDKLYLGVSRKVITPKVGCQLYGYSPDVFSTAVADDLTVSAFYFIQGGIKAMMLTVTVCGINTELADSILSKISENCGIAKEYISLSATHTHSGPNVSGRLGWGDMDKEYCNEIFIPQILAAAKEATQNPVAVTVGTAVGESRLGVNRRELTPENEITLGQNPTGPCNLKMTVISFKDDSGRIVGNIIHYGCHGTAAGKNTEISRDWSGFMTDALEEKSGGITAFFNGPEGDIGPRLSNGRTSGGGNFYYAKEIGAIASNDALGIYESIKSYENVRLHAACNVVKIPLKPRMDSKLAKSIIEKSNGETVNIGALMLSCAKYALEANESGKAQETHLPFNQKLIAVGNCVFASFPFELFSDIGIKIDREFENLEILSLAITDGSEGYFVTEDEIALGGYEVNSYCYGHAQEYCENADSFLIKNTVENIKRLEI